jgi:iron(III) transport system ATP-binding protein
MAQIRLENLCKKYGDSAALRGVSLTIENGELLAILGPSGCGKTTTMQILAGFIVPDSGEIWADDRLISSGKGVVPPERRRMSLVFQSYALWPHLTVFQNIAFGLEMNRVSDNQIKERVASMLQLVNLTGFDKRYPHELSGGQQQRVALARALIVEPDTLLLDEPLSNLDANLREQMRFEIRRIHERTRITTVYVTHDQAEALVIADRIAVMNGGVIEQTGTPREIYERPRSKFVASFIGGANCLSGQVVEPGVVRCGQLQFRTSENGSLRAGEDVVLCIRPHAVKVHPARPANGANVNFADGRLLQQAYLGDLQDIRITLASGAQLRALTATGRQYQPGEEVFVELPREHCYVVYS